MDVDFAHIVSAARRDADMTAAEFDYSLSVGGGQANAAFANVIYRFANRDLPVVQAGDGPAELQRRSDRADALREQLRPQIEAMIEAAKAKSYTGWSVHSAGPIRYAR